jgi:uncharacterized protein (DUF952 family)
LVVQSQLHGYGAAQISGVEVPVLYKIMSQQEWETAQANGIYEGSEVDRSDGFIHLSAAHQLRATAQKHFSGKADLLLVSVAEEVLGQSLKWEVSRGGDLFPHVYGALPLSAVSEVVPLPLVDGVHQFPERMPS